MSPRSGAWPCWETALSHSLHHPQLQPPVYQLCFWLAGHRLEVPTTLPLGLMNSIEQLPELKETFYLLHYWFVMKEGDSGTARWKNAKGQVWRTAWHFCALSQQAMCSPTWKLSEPSSLGFYGGFITKASLINPLVLGNWTQLPVSLPSLEVRGGTKSSNF